MINSVIFVPIGLSWSASRGLEIYIDGQQMAWGQHSTSASALNIRDWNIYLGRPNTQNLQGMYANALFDEAGIGTALRRQAERVSDIYRH